MRELNLISTVEFHDKPNIPFSPRQVASHVSVRRRDINRELVKIINALLILRYAGRENLLGTNRTMSSTVFIEYDDLDDALKQEYGSDYDFFKNLSEGRLDFEGHYVEQGWSVEHDNENHRWIFECSTEI